MALIELNLRGFNGNTDETDHLILWVESDLSETQTQACLAEAGLYVEGGVIANFYALPETMPTDEHDFRLPEQLRQLTIRAESLVIEHEKPLPLKKLLAATDQHAEDAGDFDYAIGDLQALLKKAWEIMSVGQRLQLLNSEEVADVVETGAREEFNADDLVAILNRNVRDMGSVVGKVGYAFMQHEGGFYWETPREASEDFRDRDDAIASAYADLLTQSATI